MVKKTKMIIITLLVCLVSFFAGWFSQTSLTVKKDKVPLPKIQIAKNDRYTKVENFLVNNFSYNGYTEIMGTLSHSVYVVPDGVAGRQDLSKEGLYANERHYVYKNGELGVVILVSLSRDQQHQADPTIWKHSYGYENSDQNRKTGTFASSYHPNLPNIEVQTYAFGGQGYNLSLTAISENKQNKTLFTISALAEFTEKLARELRANDLLE